MDKSIILFAWWMGMPFMLSPLMSTGWKAKLHDQMLSGTASWLIPVPVVCLIVLFRFVLWPLYFYRAYRKWTIQRVANKLLGITDDEAEMLQLIRDTECAIARMDASILLAKLRSKNQRDSKSQPT